MSSSTPLHFTEVLDKERLAILPLLEIFRTRGFYLAGGTALALLFGHRESEDFDFFVGQDFDEVELFQFCLIHFKGKNIEKIEQSKSTLWITVDDIKISFITFQTPLLDGVTHTPHIDIASVPDIGCMKLWTIQNRATQKDYVDILFIIRNIGLTALIESFQKKHGSIVAESQLLKSLTYFDDITPVSLKMIDRKVTWEMVTDELGKVVKNYMKK